MNVRYITSLAVLLLFLSLPFAHAASVTVDIFGTNASNAQSNLTQTGNNSYQVVQWAVGDPTKSLKADINGNASDDITFTLHNFTVGRVIEVKVNSTAYDAFQADSTGTISFNRTQTVRNQTYSFTPALQVGGYNATWGWFWHGLPNISLPLSALNRSDTNIYSGNNSNVSVVRNANGTYNIDIVKDNTVTPGYGYAYNATTSGFAATNTWYDIYLDDGDGQLVSTRHSLTTNSERIYVNNTGVYSIASALHFSSALTIVSVTTRMLKNGTEIVGSGCTKTLYYGDVCNIEIITNMTQDEYVSLQAGVANTGVSMGVQSDASLPDLSTNVVALITVERID